MLVFHNEAGEVTGTFSGNVRAMGRVPAAFVETDLTDDELGELSDWRVEGGALVRAALAGAKAAAALEVGVEIAAARRLYITDLPGQGMIYLDKEGEAARYLAQDPPPADLGAYPWIKREVGTTGATAYEVAQVFVNMAAQWRVVGPEIEGLRLEAKDAIAAASTADEISAALAALKTGLESYL